MLVDSGRVPRPAQGYQIPTMSNLMTFHKILPGCEEGNRAAWRAFLTDYTPMGFQLFGVYSPWTPERCLDAWHEALRVLSADQCTPLRSFSHQSERAFLLAWIATKLEPSQDAEEPPAPTAETLPALLKGLPVLH